ncbi:hypothetical protein HPB51_020489 [Rhipicephalus microplus]|uniref:Uncharacterized protein n=1 Tax=Rhipicephalus microplus TaxID=6941 RepID=A0A9J6E344_RHIMP|nr:hypothetical protein HPB51_020489 [Rhipicephalus microplus]
MPLTPINRQLQVITIGDRHHEVNAYEMAPDNTVKGIIKGIPLEEDAKSIHTSTVHARSTHQCSLHCKLCEGAHMTADSNCRARYKTPYIVTKRQWERRRANEEAEATATNYSHSKPRSRSRTPSRSHSRSRSRTPGARKQQQRRSRSRTSGRTPTRDAKATDSAQVHAKDELIQKLLSAVHSETDQQAMQETQEELIEDGEVEGPDTKRGPAISLKWSVRPKRTCAATGDTKVKALEARVSSLEETITATITCTIKQSLESIYLRLSRLEAANSPQVTLHSEAAPHM